MTLARSLAMRRLFTKVRLFQHGFFPFLTVQIAYAVGLTGTLNVLLSRLNQTKHIASLIFSLSYPNYYKGKYILMQLIISLIKASGGSPFIDGSNHKIYILEKLVVPETLSS
ncbi:hypothetical protein MKW92_033190 [Papaver armeniacum]|nr:hypothetical protein MKW92_033190 [Papaver armeniacum]